MVHFVRNSFSRLVLTAQHMINTDENQNEKGERYVTNQEALETKYASYPCHCNDQKATRNIYVF